MRIAQEAKHLHCIAQVAALGLQPLASRAFRRVPANLTCFASIVVPTCVACLCDERTLALLYAVLLIPLASNVLRALSSPSAPRVVPTSRPAALTSLRGAIALQTAFCILAVDFRLFPRAGAKTLTYGRSLMDLGVGAVVVSGALTRRKKQTGNFISTPPHL